MELWNDVRCSLERIPDVRAFPTVDEMQGELDRLAARHPDLVQLRRVGTSRMGEPIRMASIGRGARNVLVFGGPHPDEPVGSLTVRELGRILCADDGLRAATGVRWHLIPSVDPDGARLNEGWYAEPGTRAALARGFYRPAMQEQVEWTFPDLRPDGWFDRMLPETVTLARVIDELRPLLQCSLHNAEYGGVFYYLSAGPPELAAGLSEVPGRFGLPLHAAAWEVPGSSVLAPGVFRSPSAEEVREPGAPAAFGVSSGEYAARHGTVTMISEVPYWEDPRAADTTPCGRSFADVLGAAVSIMEATVRELRPIAAAAAPDLVLDTPFRRAFDDAFAACSARATGLRRLAGDPGGARPATVAEEHSFEVLTHLLRVRLVATLRRLVVAEHATGNTRPGIRAALREAQDVLDGWCAEADAQLPGSPIPVRTLVATQVASTLVAASHLGPSAA